FPRGDFSDFGWSAALERRPRIRAAEDYSEGNHARETTRTDEAVSPRDGVCGSRSDAGCVSGAEGNGCARIEGTQCRGKEVCSYIGSRTTSNAPDSGGASWH